MTVTSYKRWNQRNVEDRFTIASNLSAQPLFFCRGSGPCFILLNSSRSDGIRSAMTSSSRHRQLPMIVDASENAWLMHGSRRKSTEHARLSMPINAYLRPARFNQEQRPEQRMHFQMGAKDFWDEAQTGGNITIFVHTISSDMMHRST